MQKKHCFWSSEASENCLCAQIESITQEQAILESE